MSVSSYKTKIYRLVKEMHGVIVHEKIRGPNRAFANEYLANKAFNRLELMLRSTKSLPESTQRDPRISELTQHFSRLEEERLKRRLKRVSYVIDTPDTVSLLTGPGRIERVSLYLLTCSLTIADDVLVYLPLDIPSPEASSRYSEAFHSQDLERL